MAILTLNPTYDALLSLLYGTVSGGSSNTLTVRRTGEYGEDPYADEIKGFIRFPNISIPSSQIESATLSLTITGRVSIQYTSARLTVANSVGMVNSGSGSWSDASGTPLASLSLGSGTYPRSSNINVTSLVKFMADNNKNTFFLDASRFSERDAWYSFATREHTTSSYKPVLTITYTNSTPTTPSSISVPTLKGGEVATISWGASTDADGDSISYRLERSINGGSFSQVYSGSSRSKSESPLSTWNTVAYRVRAYDGQAYSGYTTSPTRTVTHNTAPTIPSSITVPTLKGGEVATISWGASTDSDGDTINYYLERSINGGSYTVIRSGGTSRSYDDTIDKSWNTVTYRVRAYDGTVYSGYRTSSATTVKHFPEFHMRINGALKTSDGGWVRINGVLREIESITVKINGALKEV